MDNKHNNNGNKEVTYLLLDTKGYVTIYLTRTKHHSKFFR